MRYHPPFWEEPKKTDFKSEVKKVDDKKVVLQESYFHPEEGGQPADKGTLDGYEVRDVQKEDSVIVHHLEDHDLEVGEKVKGKVDEEFRLVCMRGHTGAHIVYGAGRKVMGDVNYAGFDITEKKARIDFESDAHVERENLLKMEELCNEIILDNRPVRWEFLDKEELENSEEIAFAKEIPEGEEIRIIEVEDWDRGVCSGTHLQRTLQVGRIRIEGKKKLQEGVTRINFSFGKEALKRDYKEKRAVLRALRALRTNPEELPTEVERLQRRKEKMDEKIDNLEAQKIKLELESFEKHGFDRFDFLIQTLSTENSQLLSHKAKEEVGKNEIMVILNEREELSAVIGVGEKIEEISASQIIQKLSQEFGGGGGGTDKFAQGGGFDADPQDLKNFLMDELTKT